MGVRGFLSRAWGMVCGGEDSVVEGGCGGLCCWFLGTGKGSGWGGLAFDWDLSRGGKKSAVGFYGLRLMWLGYGYGCDASIN